MIFQDSYSGTFGIKDSGGRFQLGSTNQIAGWTFDNGKFNRGTDIVLDATNKRISVFNNAVQMYYNSAVDYGLKDSAGRFSLGSINKIGAFTFNNEDLYQNIKDVKVWIGNDPAAQGLGGVGFGIQTNNATFIRLIGDGGYSYLQAVKDNLMLFNLNTEGDSSIANFKFSGTKFYTDKLELNSNGNIDIFRQLDGTTGNINFNVNNVLSGKISTNDESVFDGWQDGYGLSLQSITNNYNTRDKSAITGVYIVDNATNIDFGKIIINGEFVARGGSSSYLVMEDNHEYQKIKNNIAFNNVLRMDSNITMPTSSTNINTLNYWLIGKTIKVLNVGTVTRTIYGVVGGNISLPSKKYVELVYAEYGEWFRNI